MSTVGRKTRNRSNPCYPHMTISWRGIPGEHMRRGHASQAKCRPRFFRPPPARTGYKVYWGYRLRSSKLKFLKIFPKILEMFFRMCFHFWVVFFEIALQNFWVSDFRILKILQKILKLPPITFREDTWVASKNSWTFLRKISRFFRDFDNLEGNHDNHELWMFSSSSLVPHWQWPARDYPGIKWGYSEDSLTFIKG